MNRRSLFPILLLASVGFTSCSTHDGASTPVGDRTSKVDARLASAQVPDWSAADLQFFLHGSMSTEIIPERAFRAIIATFPDLYPKSDLSHFGLLPDPEFGWPVGFSRRQVSHLGNQVSVGINCASCHVGDIQPPGGAPGVRVLGMTSQFDAEAFFGALFVSTFRLVEPTNLHRFLGEYVAIASPAQAGSARELLNREWQRQEARILETIEADPFGSSAVPTSGLHDVPAADLELDLKKLEGSVDLSKTARSYLRLFHNLRAALHVPDKIPETVPPASGPGRNDAFGLLSASLFGHVQPYAPVKYGLVWNVRHRYWVHWDGNTRSPLGRNLLAALGLGTPLIGRRGQLDFAALQRQTRISEEIQPPRYPFAVDQEAARRGASHYQALCASCHSGPEGDHRLYSVTEVGTEPVRASSFTQAQADRFNGLLSGLEIAGYRPGSEPGIRGTGKYWASSLDGVWARSPYLHNGSVRTMQELLTPPGERAKGFQRGGSAYDPAAMGYLDAGPYRLDTSTAGNSNAGHDYGSGLGADQKRDLIEYLKTL